MRRALLLLFPLVACGDATTATPPTPNVGKAVSLALGQQHSCALAESGNAYCWGSGADGRLGNGALANAASPLLVRANGKATAIASGLSHTCILQPDGTVACWGHGTSGELGTDKSSSPTPRQVAGVANAVAITAGEGFGCAIVSGGTAPCWGGGNATVKSIGLDGATAMTMGQIFFCAIVAGQARCLGEGSVGQLGGGTGTDSLVPVDVIGVTGATAIDAGEQHACAILADRTIRCWGSNGLGRLGNGETSGSKPTAVPVAGIDDAIALALGGNFSCALRATGVVQCWGGGTEGQLGDGKATDTPLPVTVATLTNVTAIGAGDRHACAVHDGGKVSCWGSNLGPTTSGTSTRKPTGQLGDATITIAKTPIAVPGFG